MVTADLTGPLVVSATTIGVLSWLKNHAAPQQLAFSRKSATPYQPQRAGSVAILPLMGWLNQRGNIAQVSRALKAAVADKSVKHIIIEIDSSGGSAYGVQELADQVYQARDTKRITAIANSVAVSGAYWIGSQAHEFFVTPGGEVGGVGVYMLHEDISCAMTKSGIKTTMVYAGKHKTEGNPLEPLSKDSERFMKSVVDKRYSIFISAVARGRGVSIDAVTKGMGQGRTVGATQAVKARMADGVKSMNDLFGNTGSSAAGVSSKRRRAMALAMLH